MSGKTCFLPEAENLFHIMRKTRGSVWYMHDSLEVSGWSMTCMQLCCSHGGGGRFKSLLRKVQGTQLARQFRVSGMCWIRQAHPISPPRGSGPPLRGERGVGCQGACHYCSTESNFLYVLFPCSFATRGVFTLRVIWTINSWLSCTPR